MEDRTMREKGRRESGPLTCEIVQKRAKLRRQIKKCKGGKVEGRRANVRK